MDNIKPVIFLHKHNVTPDTVVANIAANAGRDLPSVEFKRVCVCASGPSLASHLDAIRRRKALGFDIASMNGSHNFLVQNGIVPDLFFMVDARHDVNLPFVAAPNDHTTYVIASQCQPEIFKALAGRKVMLWQVDNYEGAGEAIRERAPAATVFGGACNVGQSCLSPLMAMGYRVMHLYGFDGPTRTGEGHAFDQPQNAGDDKVEFFFEGERFVGSGTQAHDANAFVDRYRLLTSLGIDIQVYGDNLLQCMVRSRKSSAANVTIPAPRPRQKAAEKLQVVCWKWRGHVPYTAEHVNTLARGVSRWLKMPHEIVCITDDPEGVDGGIRVVPMWRDHFEHGRDWHRLKVFSPEMADIIGPRFTSIDLDSVICGPLDPLFDHNEPFKAWRDPYRPHQYCTALFQMDAGAYPHVIEHFDAKTALSLRTSGQYNGYDQAWISYVLPGQPVWTAEDGVLSFKRDVLKGEELPEYAGLPDGARIVTFHGKFDPSHTAVQQACPWIADNYY